MTLRYLGSAFIAVVFTGAVIVGPAHAQIRDGGLLPQDQSAMITVVGCLVNATDVQGGHEGKFVLSQPAPGPINSVENGNCAADPTGNALALQHTDKNGVNESLVGHVVEINGRLEKENDDNPDNLRELKIRSFRLVPVVPPAPRAQAAPQERIIERQIVQVPAPAAEPAPVGTTGQAPTLPRTAGELPLVGLMGLLSLTGAFLFRSFQSLG